MASIETLLDELQTHRAALDLPQEGARDYEEVNLKEPAHLLASEGRGEFTAQRALTMAAIESVQSLSDASGDNAEIRALAMAAIEALQALMDASSGNPNLLTLVIAVVEAMRALLENSDYPDLPSFEADAPVLDDLDAQIASMLAFRARVRAKAPAANRMEITFTVSDQP